MPLSESEERFDVCDEQGRPTGETVGRTRAHREGIPHRTVHIWIAREKDGRCEVLLQKRSRNKDSFPGLWDTSSAGHISAGDEPLPSALRELEEELGLRASAEDLRPIGRFTIRYEKVFHGALFRDHEIVWLYLCTAPVELGALRLQPEEVEAVLANCQYVDECLVVDRDGKITALVYSELPEDMDEETKAAVPGQIRVEANKSLPNYSKIAVVEMMPEPFEKTPKRTIKRFLYK